MNGIIVHKGNVDFNTVRIQDIHKKMLRITFGAYSVPGISKKNIFTPQQMMVIVAEYFNITVDIMTSSARDRYISYPRAVSQFLMRHFFTNLRHIDIANYHKIGNHTNVVHHIKQVKGLMQSRMFTAFDISVLSCMITNRKNKTCQN